MRMTSAASCVRELRNSVLDPWEFVSCIPDGAHGVGKFSIKQSSQAATTATGSCVGYALSCSSPQVYDLTGLSAGATSLFGSNWSAAANYAAISNFYGRKRLVSAGIKVGFTGNTTSDSGIICFAQIPAGITLANLSGITLAQLTALAQYYEITPVRNGGRITWRPCDYDDQGAFVEDAATTLANSATTVTRPYLVAIVFGMAINGAGSILVESVTNWEGQFVNPTFSPGGNTANIAPAVPGWFELAQNAYRIAAPILTGALDIGWPQRQTKPLSIMGRGPTVEDLD